MLYKFAKSYVDPGFLFSAKKNQLVWLEGFDSKQSVFIRNWLFGKNCEYQLWVRPQIDGDNVVWFIESSKDHSHAELSKQRVHDLAVKYGLRKV